jgi:spore coat protein U-like protein
MTRRANARPSRLARRLLSCLALAWLALGRPASAACTVSVTAGVAFGGYDVFGTSPVDSAGQVRWTCDFLTFPAVRITLSRGGNTTFLPRRMSSGANRLDYNLYLDAARTRVWGDGSPGTELYSQQFWGFGTITVSIYGRIPAAQNAAVGAYTDNVMVVINY